MFGFDINPLAILISKAKYTKVSLEKIIKVKTQLRNQIFEFIKDEDNFKKLTLPKITNINFWFSQEVLQNLNVIKHFLDQIQDEKIKRFFRVPFSETVRECSYTRNNEFKLYKMK